MQNEPQESISETIIISQSVLLMLLAIAGICSSDAVCSAYNALTNAQSSAYIITDNAIVTETESISMDRIIGIINNFETINATIFAIGFIIFTATIIRVLRK